MKQMLQRGFAIANGERITRVVAENSLWQIYLTNCEGYVLAVTPELYNCWVDNYALPQDLFIAEKEHNCYIFSCSKSERAFSPKSPITNPSFAESYNAVS